nr:site-specific integrase [Treponemataceae bacterium]
MENSSKEKLSKENLSYLLCFYNELVSIDGKANLTSQTYCFSVELFLLYLQEQNLNLKDVDLQTLVLYFVKRQTEGLETLTRAKDISALRSFGDYLVRNKIWQENFALDIEKPKISKNIPKVLSVEEVDTLLSVIKTDSDLGIRDRA